MSGILFKFALAPVLIVSLAACGGFGSIGGQRGDKEKFTIPRGAATEKAAAENPRDTPLDRAEGAGTGKNRKSIWDLFGTPDQNVNVRVNKYLWSAAIETLNFLPVEAADPFTGIMVLGWGSAPGSNRQYRATVLVQDPALDARSLKLSIQTRGGTASAETVRRIEEAILTRARQLRIRDKNL